MRTMRAVFLIAVIVYGVESRERLEKVAKDLGSSVASNQQVDDSSNQAKHFGVEINTGRRYDRYQPGVHRQAQPSYLGQKQYQVPQQYQPQQYQPQQKYQGQKKYYSQSQYQAQNKYRGEYQPIDYKKPQNQFQYQQPTRVEQVGDPFRADPIVQQISRTQIPNAQLYQVQKYATARQDPYSSLISRLPSNATVIRPNIVDSFSCAGKIYGYYADTYNECQIFHVCFPLRQVFLGDPSVPDITYHFSFICNSGTLFNQPSMTCVWETDAVECQYASQFYAVNEEFFKTTTPQYQF